MGSTLIDRASAEQLSTFRLFGRLPGAELSDNDALLRICTGHQIALFNGVLDTEISDAEQLDDAIADTVGYFAERGLPFLWWTRPSSAPVVRDRLINAGFVAAGTQPVMTHALSDPPPDARLDGLRIRAVETDEDLEIYGAILVRGFGLPEFVGDVFVTLLRDLGTGPDTEARTFIGTLDGEDVATAAVFLHGDTAGVYNVSTIESARRRGIGAAITLACEDEARSRGFELATLQSSEAGYGVYKALGYEEVCKFEQFILAG